MKTRPYRIYKKRDGHKKYIRKDGKRTYIKMKDMAKISNKNLVNVMIKNVVGHKRVPSRKTESGKPLAYTQKVEPKLLHVPHTPFQIKSNEERKPHPSGSREAEEAKVKEERKPHPSGSREAEGNLMTEVEHNKIVEAIGHKEDELNAKNQKLKEYNASHVIRNVYLKKKLKEVFQTQKPQKPKIVVETEENGAKPDYSMDDHNANNWTWSHLKTDERRRFRAGLMLETQDYDKIKSELGRKEGTETRDRVLQFESENSVGSENHKISRPYIPVRDDHLSNQIVQGGEGSGAYHPMDTVEIEKFLESRTHHIIPCIPHDKMDTLLPHVNKDTKEFGFVFNTQNHNQGGQHWKACYINTETGECDYFDSLVSEPDKTFMKGITRLIEKINPPIYLKFKINRVKLQNNTSANCGQFCCQFLDKMFHGSPFKQATFYNTINGEKNVEHYKSKWGLL